MGKGSAKVKALLAELLHNTLDPSKLTILYKKLNQLNVRSLKDAELSTVLSHCKSSTSLELSVSAFSLALQASKAEFTSHVYKIYSGGLLELVELSHLMVQKYAKYVRCHHIGSNNKEPWTLYASKAMEVLASTNELTISKLLKDTFDCTEMIEDLHTCLKNEELVAKALPILKKYIMLAETDLQAYENKSELLTSLFPLLFDKNHNIRRDSLCILENLKPLPLINELRDDVKTKYCDALMTMINEKVEDWPKLWIFCVKYFDKELHVNAPLINCLLGIVEKAFKFSDESIRVQAFDCWNVLIDNFTPSLNKKRLDLLLIPIRTRNHRSEKLTAVKLDTYRKLLESVKGKEEFLCEVLKQCLTFCFGSQEGLLSAKMYPALHSACGDMLKKSLDLCKESNVFPKLYSLIINGTADCVSFKYNDNSFVLQVWRKLLDLILTYKTQDIYKDMVKSLLEKIDFVVASSINFKRTDSSTSKTDCTINNDLAGIIVNPLLYECVFGPYALQASVFNNMAFFVGSTDDAMGTPSLLFIEWLLKEVIVISSGKDQEYHKLMTTMVSYGCSSPGGLLSFIQSVLRKFQKFSSSAVLEQEDLPISLADTWCILAKCLTSFMNEGGEINQGDAAQHNFQCLYSVLLVPAQYIFSHISLCCRSWRLLYHQASSQTALVMTTKEHEFSDQVTCSLVKVATEGKNPKQIAAVYCLLNVQAKVESSDGLKMSKNWNAIQYNLAQKLKDLLHLGIDEEDVFVAASQCLNSLLQPIAVDRTVALIEILHSLIIILLKSSFSSNSTSNCLEEVFNSLAEILPRNAQHHKQIRSFLKSKMAAIVKESDGHSNNKVRRAAKKLSEMFEKRNNKSNEPSDLFVKSPGKSGSVLRSPGRNSPKSPLRTSPSTIFGKGEQLLSSSRSPLRKATKRPPPESGDVFVRIDTPPKKIILTEHQKEKMRERRQGQNIPALYEDLTQDTQSMGQDASQDCSVIPPTQESFKSTKKMLIDEDAVLDVNDVDMGVKVLPRSPTDVEKKLTNPRRSPSFASSEAAHSFTPPAGFRLSSETTPKTDKQQKKVHKDRSPTESAKKVLEVIDCTVEHEKNASKSQTEKKTEIYVNEDKHAPDSENFSEQSTDSGKGESSKFVAPVGRRRGRPRKSLPVKNLSTVTRSTLKNAQEDVRSNSPAAISPRRKRLRSSLSAIVISDESTETDTSDDQLEKTKKKSLNSSFEKNILGVITENNKDKSKEECLDSQKNNSGTQKKRMPTRNQSSFRNEEVSPRKEKSTDEDSSSSETYGTPSGRALGGKILRRSSSKSSLSDEEVRQEKENTDSSSKQDNLVDSIDLTQSEDVIESSQDVTPLIKRTNAVVDIKLKIKDTALSSGNNTCKDARFTLKSPLGRITDISGSTESPSASIVLKLCTTPTKNNQEEAIVVLDGDDPDTAKIPSPNVVVRLSKLSSPTEKSAENLIGKPVDVIEDEDPKENGTNLISVDSSDSDSPPDVIENVDTPSEVVEKNSSPTKLSSVPPVKEQVVETKLYSPKSVKDCTPSRSVSPQNKVARSLMTRRAMIGFSSKPDAEVSCSPPRDPTSVQQKRANKANADTNSSNVLMKRSGRAAQILAAARGGETISSSGGKFSRMDTDCVDDNADKLNSKLGSGFNSNIFTTVLSSPSLRRKSRLLKNNSNDCVTPDSSEDGPKEEWIPKEPRPDATPDSSILKKRKRDCSLADADLSPSPSKVKKKRVSFRDPPLSKLLSFSDNSDKTGVIYNSFENNDCSANSNVEVNARRLPRKIICDTEAETILPTDTESDKNAADKDQESTQVVVENAKEIEKENELEDAHVESVDLQSPEKSEKGESVLDNIEKEARQSSIQSEQEDQLKNRSDDDDENSQKRKKEEQKEKLKARTEELDKLRKESMLKWKEEQAKARAELDKELEVKKSALIKRHANDAERSYTMEEEASVSRGKVLQVLENWVIKGETDNKKLKEFREECRAKELSHLLEAELLTRERQNIQMSWEEVTLNQQFKEFDSCELMDIDTQSSPTVLHQKHPSIYPSLKECQTPIEEITPHLTSPSWHNSFLGFLKDRGITTVGALAALSEQKVNRLPITGEKNKVVREALKRIEDDKTLSESLSETGLVDFEAASSSTTSTSGNISDSVNVDFLAAGSSAEGTQQDNRGAMLTNLIDNLDAGDLTVEQFRSIARKAGVQTVQKALCSSDPNEPSIVSVRELRDYVVELCEPTELLNSLVVDDIYTHLQSNVKEDQMVNLVVKALRDNQLSKTAMEDIFNTIAMKMSKKEIMCLLFAIALDKTD